MVSKSTLLLVHVVLIVTQFNVISSTTYYVDPSKSTSGFGESWSDACNSLSSALSYAQYSWDEIWLRGGYTYYPSDPKDRTDCFVTNNGVSIYGGFEGTESSLDERNADPNARPQSIISGDIGILGDVTDNCYHVIQYQQSLTLDSVVIQDGNANYAGAHTYSNQQANVLHRYGGALITSDPARSTDLYLQDVIIRNNTAINGGGLHIQSTPANNVDVRIKDCTFEYNQAIHGEYEGGYGGAIYSMFLANLTIFNTKFESNKAHYRGGAIYEDYGSYLYIDGSDFINNYANGYGGALFGEDRNSQTSGTFPVVINSVFTNNYATVDGGAIYWFNGVAGTLTNNQFISNTAGNKGGAIALSVLASSTSTGNTFSGNTANGDSSTNDEFTEDEDDLLYTGLDSTLSFDITAELSSLYTKWQTIQTEADLYPFDATNPLCYVDTANSAWNQDGSTWSTAYSELQSCLDDLSSTGGEIWVATGTYMPTSVPQWKLDAGKPNVNMQRSFLMYDNTKMYGGFIGTETSRDERDWRTNPTYLSCQENSRVQCNQIVNSADNTLIDGFVLITYNSIQNH